MPSEATSKHTDNGLDRPVTANGKLRLLSLDTLDQRTAAARKANELIANLARDLGRSPSTAEAQLAQRAALLSAMCEDLETRWVAGEPVDLSAYTQLTNALRRLLTTIGLRRQPKDVTATAIDLVRRGRGVSANA